MAATSTKSGNKIREQNPGREWPLLQQNPSFLFILNSMQILKKEQYFPRWYQHTTPGFGITRRRWHLRPLAPCGRGIFDSHVLFFVAKKYFFDKCWRENGAAAGNNKYMCYVLRLHTFARSALTPARI